jgi:hypothetical protein
VSHDIETKLSAKEREIDLLSEKSANEKLIAKRDLYLSTLDLLSSKDKCFSSLLLKLKSGFHSVFKQDMDTSSTISPQPHNN